MSKTKPKMIFNRNKKQLKNIFNERIDELQERLKDINEGGNHFPSDIDIWTRQISLLYWILEVINNPKGWDCIEIDENLMDELVFTQEVK